MWLFFCAGATVFESNPKKIEKRKRQKNTDPGDIDGYLGPWGKFVDEKTVMKPSEVSCAGCLCRHELRSPNPWFSHFEIWWRVKLWIFTDDICWELFASSIACRWIVLWKVPGNGSWFVAKIQTFLILLGALCWPLTVMLLPVLALDCWCCFLSWPLTVDVTACVGPWLLMLLPVLALDCWCCSVCWPMTVDVAPWTLWCHLRMMKLVSCHLCLCRHLLFDGGGFLHLRHSSPFHLQPTTMPGQIDIWLGGRGTGPRGLQRKGISDEHVVC